MGQQKTTKTDRLRELREARFKGVPTPKAPRLIKKAMSIPKAKRATGRGK